MSGIDPVRFREIMGQYPTGVVVVTALTADGTPTGMTVGSFNSASLSPALVAFMPDRESSSWRSLRESGTRFGVNVLSAEQESVCRAVAMRKRDKFEGIPWSLSPGGNPSIDGCVAFLDCEVEAILDAGDHHIVLGRVCEMQASGQRRPLLFFQGGYGSFQPGSLAVADQDVLVTLSQIDVARPHMETLARDFDTEVTASCVVRDELVLAAASGAIRSGTELTRVGRRVPFRPPFGCVFVAWGPEAELQEWIRAVDSVEASEQARRRIKSFPELIRARGCLVTLGGISGARSGWAGYNPAETDGDRSLESVTAPVFDEDGRVAFALTVWGGPDAAARASINEITERLLEVTAVATGSLNGHHPAPVAFGRRPPDGEAR